MGVDFNASPNQTAFIEVKDPDLQGRDYLEANLTAREEVDAIEVNRSLLLKTTKFMLLGDSVLDLIPVSPVPFSNSKYAQRLPMTTNLSKP